MVSVDVRQHERRTVFLHNNWRREGVRGGWAVSYNVLILFNFVCVCIDIEDPVSLTVFLFPSLISRIYGFCGR